MFFLIRENLPGSTQGYSLLRNNPGFFHPAGYSGEGCPVLPQQFFWNGYDHGYDRDRDRDDRACLMNNHKLHT
jgi:hypothetical protein